MDISSPQSGTDATPHEAPAVPAPPPSSLAPSPPSTPPPRPPPSPTHSTPPNSSLSISSTSSQPPPSPPPSITPPTPQPLPPRSTPARRPSFNFLRWLCCCEQDPIHIKAAIDRLRDEQNSKKEHLLDQLFELGLDYEKDKRFKYARMCYEEISSQEYAEISPRPVALIKSQIHLAYMLFYSGRGGAQDLPTGGCLLANATSHYWHNIGEENCSLSQFLLRAHRELASQAATDEERIRHPRQDQEPLPVALNADVEIEMREIAGQQPPNPPEAGNDPNTQPPLGEAQVSVCRNMLKTNPNWIDVCSLGVLLSEPRNMSYDLEGAAKLFEIVKDCGDDDYSKEGTFWYGRALLNGYGMQKNVDVGIKYIQQAASKGVRRALFEMGMFLEYGMRPETKNLPHALVHYQAVVVRPQNEDELLDDFERLQVFNNPDWDESEGVLGQSVGTYLSWSLAGQAFLFAAASTMSYSAQPDHYAMLLILLPIVGMVLSCYSCIISVKTFVWNRTRRLKSGLLIWVYNAKFEASRALHSHNWPGWHESSLRWFENPETVKNAGFVGEIFLVMLAILFFLSWVLLLNDEFHSKKEGCSNWRKSPCLLINKRTEYNAEYDYQGNWFDSAY